MGISLRETDVGPACSSVHGPRNKYLVIKMLGNLNISNLQTFFRSSAFGEVSSERSGILKFKILPCPRNCPI